MIEIVFSFFVAPLDRPVAHDQKHADRAVEHGAALGEIDNGLVRLAAVGHEDAAQGSIRGALAQLEDQIVGKLDEFALAQDRGQDIPLTLVIISRHNRRATAATCRASCWP